MLNKKCAIWTKVAFESLISKRCGARNCGTYCTRKRGHTLRHHAHTQKACLVQW